jgi:hypothetical protein
MTYYDDDNIQLLAKACDDALHEQRCAAVRFADSIINNLEDQDDLRVAYVDVYIRRQYAYKRYSDAVRAFEEQQLGHTP